MYTGKDEKRGQFPEGDAAGWEHGGVGACVHGGHQGEQGHLSVIYLCLLSICMIVE